MYTNHPTGRLASALLMHLRMRKVCLFLGVLAACAGPEPLPRGAALTASFDLAEQRTGVPADLLRAIAIRETGLRPGTTTRGDDHQAPSLGVLALRPTARRDQIALSESLLGIDRDQIAADPALGVIAGAEVLAFAASQGDEAPRDLRDWIEIATRESGLPEGSASRRYAAELATMLRLGAQAVAPDGERVVIAPQAIREPDGIGMHEYAAADYPEADWSPASGSNYTSGRGGNAIDTIVIHTVQGGYNGCISWFANPSAQASAHFVVRSSDGAVTQMVNEDDTAWHAGNWNVNQRSIGIEHEGWIDDPGTWYTDAMYAGSAALVRYLADKYGVPVDRDHIIGHSEVPDPNNPGQFGGAGHHTDPGSGWDWDYFMGVVDDLGGGGRPDFAAELVAVDAPSELSSGDRVVVTVDLTNTGRQTWGLESTFLTSVDDPAPLYDVENWVTPLRASGPDHSTYTTDTVGRFTFMIHAPDVTEDTHVMQHFALEQDGLGRFGPADEVVLDILVHPAGGVGDPDPGADPDPGVDPDSPDADPMPDPTPDPAHEAYVGASGCSAAPTGAPASRGLALVVALGLLIRRRRRAGESCEPGSRAH